MAEADAAGEIDWTVSIDSRINRAHQHGATLTQDTGDPPNYTNPCEEPADRALGRSRGGLSTKCTTPATAAVDRWRCWWAPDQAHDCLMLPHLLAAIAVPRLGPGRARTRPDRVVADKAYSCRATRELLRSRKIGAVIPDRSDQQANRKRRGRKGGRPISYDTEVYKGRNVVERSFNALKNWGGLATRYDKLALLYRGTAVLAAIITWLRG